MYLDLCMLADVVFHRVRVVFGAAKTVNGLHSRIREELIEDVGSKGTGIVTLWCTLGGYMELLNLSTNRTFGLSDYEIQVELELNSRHHCIRCSHRTSRIYGVDSNSVQPLRGHPFEYSGHAISATSSTEAFQTRIKIRDTEKCVICGHAQPRGLHYAHIIPQGEKDTARYALLF